MLIVKGKATMDLTANKQGAIDHPAYVRLGLFVLLGIGVLGCGRLLSSCADTPDAAKISFGQHELMTGPAKHQTVLTGFFLGGPMADLAVVSAHDKGDPRLRIYAFREDTWEPAIDVALRPEVLFVDMAAIDGRDHLISHEAGRLNWFDPDTQAERRLVKVDMDYQAGKGDPIPHIDITRDLNHDGRDDLIVPDVNGIWISTQLGNGRFSDFAKLGPPEPLRNEKALGDSRSYGEVGVTAMTIPWYLSRVREMDYNLDGRTDLVFWNEDHFDAHLQDEQGGFAPQAESFTVDVPFDSDGDYSLAFGFSGESTFALISGFRKNSKRTVLHAIRDMNSDKVADLVTLTLSGRSLAKQRSVYQIYFGMATPDGISFAKDAGATLRPGGKAGGMQPWGYANQAFQDIDGDGQDDWGFGHVTMGLGGMMRAMVCKSIAIDLEFYCPQDGSYAEKPTATRKIRPKLDPLYGGVFFPPVLAGDVNGDGRADLLAGENPNELRVYVGVASPDLFARKPQKLTVKLPADERNVRLTDLNRDGKQDILVYYPSRTEPHRVTTLISR